MNPAQVGKHPSWVLVGNGVREIRVGGHRGGNDIQKEPTVMQESGKPGSRFQNPFCSPLLLLLVLTFKDRMWINLSLGVELQLLQLTCSGPSAGLGDHCRSLQMAWGTEGSHLHTRLLERGPRWPHGTYWSSMMCLQEVETM